MKRHNQISYWRDVDISLCFFDALVCGVLSFSKPLHILGAVAFVLILIPIIGRKLYSLEKPVPKYIEAMMILTRIFLFILLLSGVYGKIGMQKKGSKSA